MIKFGTSGWRAIIADKLTFVAVRRITQAISNWIKRNQAGSQVIRGYDTRFMRAARLTSELQQELASKLAIGPADFAGL
jgi:phosphomannomutase